MIVRRTSTIGEGLLGNAKRFDWGRYVTRTRQGPDQPPRAAQVGSVRSMTPVVWSNLTTAPWAAVARIARIPDAPHPGVSVTRTSPVTSVLLRPSRSAPSLRLATVGSRIADKVVALPQEGQQWAASLSTVLGKRRGPTTPKLDAPNA